MPRKKSPARSKKKVAKSRKKSPARSKKKVAKPMKKPPARSKKKVAKPRKKSRKKTGGVDIACYSQTPWHPSDNRSNRCQVMCLIRTDKNRYGDKTEVRRQCKNPAVRNPDGTLQKHRKVGLVFPVVKCCHACQMHITMAERAMPGVGMSSLLQVQETGFGMLAPDAHLTTMIQDNDGPSRLTAFPDSGISRPGVQLATNVAKAPTSWLGSLKFWGGDGDVKKEFKNIYE